MKKLLSISIAAYNVEKTIEECLDSFLKCRYLEDLEILVINDGSSDRTVEIVSVYEKKYPQSIHLVSKENGGHGSTINASLAIATGEFYKVIDGDDWVDPVELDALCDFLGETKAELVVNDYREVYPDHTRQVSHREGYDPRKVYSFAELCPRHDFNAQIFFMHESTIRTERLRDVGTQIQEKCFYADMELVFFIGLAARTVQFHESCAYQYRLGSAGQSVSAEGWYKHIEDFVKIELDLMYLYSEQEGKIADTTKRNYLFAILDTRYYMLFDCFLVKFQQADKDALFVDFLRTARRRYPALVDRMYLSRLNRFVAAAPEKRIGQMRWFKHTNLFKALRMVKNFGKKS